MPAAPASPPVAAPAPAAPSAPAQPASIRISPPSSPPAPAKPVSDAPAAPRKAMDRMRDKLESFSKKDDAKPKPGAPSTDAAPKQEAEPPATPADDPSVEGMDDSSLEEPPVPKTDEAPTDRPPTDQPKKDKVSPWRLVDQWKSRTLELEKQLADLKGGALNEVEKKSYEEKVQKYEQRVKEMEDKMVLLDYRQSQDFKDRFEKPYYDSYNAARQRIAAMKTESGETASAETFDAIMQQPDDDSAAQMIEEMFGTGVKASTVTQLREKVLEMSRAATHHLKEQTEAGAAKLKEQQELMQKSVGQIRDHITKTWDAANKALLEDPKVGQMFKPREGDPEWNQRLSKGYELTDRAFSENASDPRLSPEQRASIVKRHAAVRNRAAAFGALRFEVSRLQQKLEAAEKELGNYRQSEPGGGEGKGKTGDMPPAGSAWERMEARLRQAAR